MKCRFERATGCSYDDVRVHYHSSAPERVSALAYTQGDQVYIAPGQEPCLPHELVHVFQQKLGRVPAEGMTPQGAAYNNSAVLEREADEMARSILAYDGAPVSASLSTAVRSSGPIQRVIWQRSGGSWYAVGEQDVEPEKGEPTAEQVPDPGEGDIYDMARNKYTPGDVAAAETRQLILDAQERARIAHERGDPPRDIVEKIAYTSMNDKVGPARIQIHPPFGTKGISVGKGRARQKGDPRNFQPMLRAKGPTNYKAIARTLDAAPPESRREIGRMGYRYLKSDGNLPPVQSDLPEPIKRAGDTLIGVVSVEPSQTRADPDRGKLGRAMLRALGTYSAETLFGPDDAAFPLARRGGNQFMREVEDGTKTPPRRMALARPFISPATPMSPVEEKRPSHP